MYDIIETTLSAAVADNGTFTLSYPANRSAGDYTGAHKHKMAALQTIYNAPVDFTVSFDATVITVTYKGSTTLPVGTKVVLSADRLGTDDGVPEKVVLPASIARGPLHILNLGSPDADDANGYVESQDLTAAGVFSVNTTAAAAIAAAALDGTADVPRNVVASWTGTAVLTITGTDVDGNTLVESSASGTSLTGKKAFKTVTGISTSANITALTVGTGDVLGLPAYVPDASYVIAELKNGVAQPRKPGTVWLEGRTLDAGTASSTWIASPVAGTIKKLTTILHAAISGADEVYTVEVNGTAVVGLSLTIANASSAAGDVDSDTPTAGDASTAVAVGDKIEVINSGASTGVALVTWVLEIELSPVQQLNGTFVAGVTTAPTATTGDVRGTYDPETDADGSTAFALVVALPDPGNAGVAQYAG